MSDLDDKRKKAESWINGYTATAVGVVLAAAAVPVPGTATAALCTLDATM